MNIDLSVGATLPNGALILQSNIEANKVLAYNENAATPYVVWDWILIDNKISCSNGDYFGNFFKAVDSYRKETGE